MQEHSKMDRYCFEVRWALCPCPGCVNWGELQDLLSLSFLIHKMGITAPPKDDTKQMGLL